MTVIAILAAILIALAMCLAGARAGVLTIRLARPPKTTKGD